MFWQWEEGTCGNQNCSLYKQVSWSSHDRNWCSTEACQAWHWWHPVRMLFSTSLHLFIFRSLKWFWFCSCVQIRNWFDYRNHICIVSIYSCLWFDKFEGAMNIPSCLNILWVKKLADGCKWFQQVFEKLGPSLYDFLRKNSYRSFPIDLVRELGRQLLESVACVWTILAPFSSNILFSWWLNPIKFWFGHQ